jgi:hypothetical protein
MICFQKYQEHHLYARRCLGSVDTRAGRVDPDPDPVGSESESKISILPGSGPVPGPEIFLLPGPGPKILDPTGSSRHLPNPNVYRSVHA